MNSLQNPLNLEIFHHKITKIYTLKGGIANDLIVKGETYK